MTARAKPPADFDDNPELGPDFFTRAKPAAFGANARLRQALEDVIAAHETGQPLDKAISAARAALLAAE